MAEPSQERQAGDQDRLESAIMAGYSSLLTAGVDAALEDYRESVVAFLRAFDEDVAPDRHGVSLSQLLEMRSF